MSPRGGAGGAGGLSDKGFPLFGQVIKPLLPVITLVSIKLWSVMHLEGLQRILLNTVYPWGLSVPLSPLWEIFDPFEEKVSFWVGDKDR